MNRNYRTPRVDARWSEVRETHPAVAQAIHAIADSTRTAEQIWKSPTNAEWDHVTMAVEEYLRHGDYEQEPDGRYPWGLEAVVIDRPGLLTDEEPSEHRSA